MRPRQNQRDFQHNTSSSYQHLNQSPNLMQQQQPQQSMAPPPLQQTTVGASATARPQLPTPDLFSELIKLGLNPEDMTKQSNRPIREREEMFKNLQAILGKREVAELLQKLPPLNDWPMQSITPPEFSRVVGGGNISGVNSRDSVVCGPSGIVSSGGSTSGAVSFSNNNITNNGNSGQQEQDTPQFASAQHQATASAINHHQHFRIPTTNTPTVHNSPQQQQHKPVLSIHQQQHQHDPTNRRSNHQHNLSTTPNSFTNLNDMSRAPSSSSSSSSSSTNSTILDSHNSNIYNNKASPPVASYTITSTGSSQRIPSLMDTLGGSLGGGITGPGFDNIYDNPAFQQQSNLPSRDNLVNQQQSLIRHQQLQRLLRASAGAAKNASASTSNVSARIDLQNSQRNSSNNYTNNMSQMQRQLTSPNTSSAISPPQPTVPKSLLNLAACSSSPPATNNISSLTSGNRLSRNINQQANYHNSSGNINVSNNRTSSRGNTNAGPNNVLNSRVPSGVDPSNLLQQMMARSSQGKTSTSGHINRSNPTNQTLTSLLSDDQKNSRNTYNPVNSQPPGSHNRTNSQPTQRRQQQNLNDETNTVHSSTRTKEAYLAYLQERAAKAGISIGEIKTPSTSLEPNQTNAPQQEQPLVNLSNQPGKNDSDGVCNKEEIESALSRVEARNDLSLLCPPISLAHNSQKQVNVISAGLSNDLDLFTDEVKMIVQEECNIIYECKGCSNLFRSLANLVKHKRSYCNEANNESVTSFELNRRVNLLNSSIDLSVTKTTQSSELNNNYGELDSSANDKSIDDLRRLQQPIDASIPNQKYNLRGKHLDVSSVCGDIRSPRSTSNQDRNQSFLAAQETSNSSGNITDSNYCSPSKQTNLSRLLQSQPKNRPLGIKDSALMDALNMLPSATPANKLSIITSKGKNCPINELNEQLVRNSSLAKTLLNEKAKTIGSNQSLIELSEAEASGTPKRTTVPKRKFLEDCIKKVKRDKLVPSEDVNPSTSSSIPPRSDFDVRIVDDNEDHPIDDLGQFKDPLAIDDSGTDSDALVMDFDESYTPNRRKSSQDSKHSTRGRTRSSTVASSSTTNNKLNSSSALLKALTRPVETRSAFVSNQRSQEDKATTDIVPLEARSTLSSAIAPESDGAIPMSTSDQKNYTENLNVEHKCDNISEQDQEFPPSSPLFDKYTCEICEIDLQNQSLLLAHILDTHKNEKKIYPCIFCSFSFITLENVCRHIIDMHKKTKTQVGRLKDVVLSRSFISSDFATCSDHPPVPSTSQASVESDVNTKSKIDPVSPEKSITRRNSSALSDTTTAQQILEDTLAMVSDGSSPNVTTTASSQRLASIMSRARLAGRRVSSSNTDDPPSILEPDDPLCDSIITNITDEHLAILEKQEAEIEAERIRREQETGCDSGESSQIKSSQTSYLNDSVGDCSNQEQESLEHEVDQEDESIKHDTVDPMVVDSNDVGTSAELEQNVASYDSTDQDDNSTEDNCSDNWTNGDNSDRVRKVRETRVLNDIEKSAPEISEYSGSSLPIQDENDNEANLELRQHQKTPSKGKHIIADQLFEDNRQHSDQEDQCDDEQNLDESYGEDPVAVDPDISESQDGATESQSSSSSDNDSSSSDSDSSSDSSSSSQSDSSSNSSSSSSNNSSKGSSSNSGSSSSDDGILDGDLEEEEAEANEEEGVEEEDGQSWSRAHEVLFREDGIKDRASHCASGSPKGDTDLISSQTSDKSTSQQDYNDTAPPRHSSRAISKSATMDNYKLKVKSALRDVCGSGGSSASTASSSGPANAGAGSSGAGSGGIMKLKIQLKTQPDEKRSKVYRIVE